MTASMFGKTIKTTTRTSTSPKTRSPDEKTMVDVSTLKSLVVREIPMGYNKNMWLKRFYSRFGEVVKVFCNPSKNSATVTFKTHEAAKLAKVKGRILRKDTNPVTIFWKQERKRTLSGNQDMPEITTKSIVPPTQFQFSREKTKESELALDPQSLPLAMTTGERFKVLELIDSKLRQGSSKESDITTARAVQGTCLDMCPEKERYMREDQRRLHVFEIIPETGLAMEENSQIDHTKAIKEYDRSAADKDEPLPHELRPSPALRMTMDYLVTNIMDRGEGCWAEWFGFLWNRTRAIRKDITQQHLCDLESVDLIEKTARFHIFCGHYLCEQDLGDFDPRINTENLTKCAQTLKQFYNDLYKNQNVICPQEAEFRAYDILLNLNKGDILRQVMKYREEVRSSAIVKFAMGVFHALNSNNFVRFFRLVRSSSYLCACVLHRYFTQVRKQALRIMNYSLSVPNKEMPYPLKDIADMLAFDDENEVAEFCRFHGLTVNEPFVVFIRGSFVEPESAFPSSTALVLIESKRSCSIGQVVYGSSLPPAPQHQPVTSFDQNGRYIGGVHVVPRDKVTQRQPSPVRGLPIPLPQQVVLQPVEPPKPTVQISLEEVKDVTKGLFMEVINEMLVQITGEMFGTVLVQLKLSEELAAEYEQQAVADLIRETAENVLLDEQRHQLMQARQAAVRRMVTLTLADEIIDEAVAEESLEVAAFVYRAEKTLLIAQSKKNVTQQVCTDLLDETVADEVERLVEITVREAKQHRKAALNKIGRDVLLMRTARYYNKWMKCFHSLVRLKKLLGDFPSHAPLTSAQHQLANLIGPRDDLETRPLHSTRIFGDEHSLSESLISRQTELDRIRVETLRPVDIPLLLTSGPKGNYGSRSSSRIDWKLLLSFPGPCSPLDRSSIRARGLRSSPSLIREKFRKGCLPDDDGIAPSVRRKVELLSLYSAEVRSRLSDSTRCHVCALACYGVPSNSEITQLVTCRQFQGTCAVLLIVETKELQTHATKQEVRTRFHRLIQSKPVLPAIPAVVLLLEDNVTRVHVTNDIILSAIGAHDLKTQGQLSNVTIARLGSSIDRQTLDNVLEESVAWLCQHSEHQLKLESDFLKNFLEDGLQRFFFTALYEDVAIRKKSRLGEQCPESVISLYNAAIEHLAAVASSQSLVQVSWPITEFCKPGTKELPDPDWNAEASLMSLSSVIMSLSLPLPPPGAEDGTWESESFLCYEFVRTLPQTSCSLMQRVNWILIHRRHSLQNINFLSSSPRLSAAQVPWTQVIEACVSSVMTSLHSNPVLSEMDIFYLQSELDEFEQPAIWRESATLSRRECAVKKERKRVELNVPVKTRDEVLHDSVVTINKDLDQILERSKMLCEPRGSPARSTVDESLVELKNRLGSALLEARQDAESFDETLIYYTHDEATSSFKKRKADSLLDQKSPKTGRHGDVVDEVVSMVTSSSLGPMQDDFVKLLKNIRAERESQEQDERRLRSLLEETC